MVSYETTRYHFKKKSFYYKEANKEAKKAFRRRISQIDPSTLIYIDESGIDHRLYRSYARAKRGEKIYEGVSGKRFQRISMIGGWMKKNFISPMTFKGGCDQQVFNTWLKEILLPQIPPGSTLVMDNATFHKGEKTKKLIQEAKCHLLFLPTYSPDLNPIEHCWHVIKSKLKALFPIQKNLEILLGEIIIKTYQLN